MIHCLRLCAIAVVVALSITAAGATQIVQTQEFGGTPDFNRDLVFNKANLGPTCTLNWIKVILTLNVEGGQYVLDNDGEEGGSGSFNFGGQCSIINSTVPMIDVTSNPVVGMAQAGHSEAFSLAPNVDDGSGDYSPDGPDGMVYVGGLETDSRFGFINPTVFDQYIGAGTFTVTVNVTQWANFAGMSGIEAGITPVLANGNVQVIYDITCVPEPGSIVGLLSGVGLLGLLRRRK